MDTKDDYIWFFCDDDFGWVDDGLRELKDNSREFGKMIYQRLHEDGIKYGFLTGSIEDRMNFVKNILASHLLPTAMVD
jgi:nicotinamide riboside kinase